MTAPTQSNLIKSPYNLTRKIMAKEVSLSHAERLELSTVLNTAKFISLADMGYALEDAKAIVHSQEEIEKVSMKEVIVGSGTRINWTEDGELKTVTVSQTTMDAVDKALKTKEDAGEITLADQALVALQAKLKE